MLENRDINKKIKELTAKLNNHHTEEDKFVRVLVMKEKVKFKLQTTLQDRLVQ